MDNLTTDDLVLALRQGHIIKHKDWVKAYLKINSDRGEVSDIVVHCSTSGLQHLKYYRSIFYNPKSWIIIKQNKKLFNLWII